MCLVLAVLPLTIRLLEAGEFGWEDGACSRGGFDSVPVSCSESAGVVANSKCTANRGSFAFSAWSSNPIL